MKKGKGYISRADVNEAIVVIKDFHQPLVTKTEIQPYSLNQFWKMSLKSN
jgi:hypothetical protein